MYVTEKILAPVRKKYGTPDLLTFETVCPEWEMDIIIGSQKNGRAHDVTMFIFRGREIAVTAKHSYPDGLYRPPSGGLQPGESIEEGARRETYEETGLQVDLSRYILRCEAEFYSSTRAVSWTSHVFIATYVDGQIGSHDPEEIREACWSTLDRFPEYSRLMRLTDSGGLHYRAFLQEEVLRRLQH